MKEKVELRLRYEGEKRRGGGWDRMLVEVAKKINGKS